MTMPEASSLDFRNRNNRHDAFGLLAVRGYINPAIGVDQAEVRIAFGDAKATLKGPEALIERDGHTELLIHLMTHLVGDGRHTLDVKVSTPEGDFDFAQATYDLCNDSPLAAQVTDDLRNHGTPVIFGKIVDSTLFPYFKGKAEPLYRDHETGPDTPLSLEPAESAEAAHAHLRRWGFCVLPERLPEPMIKAFSTDLNAAIEDGMLSYRRGSSDRIHGAHLMPSGRDIWLYPPVLEFLKQHFGDTPCACQTLTYVNGSEQNAHQDTIHLTPYPAGYMCGVWVALQDIVEDSGELFVYPGSHVTPRLRATDLGLEKVDTDYSSYAVFDKAVQDYIDEGGYERVVYRPKAGQILVWHENLIHGGSQRADLSRERLSIVSHYFAKGSVGYYDSRGEAAALETLPVAG